MQAFKALLMMAWCVYKIIGMWYLGIWLMIVFHTPGGSGPISYFFGEEFMMDLKLNQWDYYFERAMWFNIDLVILCIIGLLGGMAYNSLTK